MTSNAERLPEWPGAEHVPAEELARRQGVRPIKSIDDLARPDLFNTKDFADFGTFDGLQLVDVT